VVTLLVGFFLYRAGRSAHRGVSPP
jgi:hypothetical protein